MLRSIEVPYSLGPYRRFPGVAGGVIARDGAEGQQDVVGCKRSYLEGQRDFESILIAPISHIVTPKLAILTYLLSPPEPPKIHGLEIKQGFGPF